MEIYTIFYRYKRKLYTTTTKPCTLAQAKYSFDTELNNLNCFKLVKIVPAQ